MSTLKKIWVDATLKKSKVAPYKDLGRFYRVPFKSLLRVQIKRVNAYIEIERQNQENFQCARCTLPTDQRRNPKGVHAIFEVQARACR